MLALAACGSAHGEQWGESRRAVDFHDIKGDVESVLMMSGTPGSWRFDNEDLPSWLHPGRAARLTRDGKPAGWLGELHPQLLARLDCDDAVFVAELALPEVCHRRLPEAHAVARFPQVRRDLAVEVDVATTWQQVADCVRQAAGPQLLDLRLFDEYTGPELDRGRKSLAMGLILQERSRTLTDEEVDERVAAVVASLSAHCSARLRG